MKNATKIDKNIEIGVFGDEYKIRQGKNGPNFENHLIKCSRDLKHQSIYKDCYHTHTHSNHF